MVAQRMLCHFFIYQKFITLPFSVSSVNRKQTKNYINIINFKDNNIFYFFIFIII